MPYFNRYENASAVVMKPLRCLNIGIMQTKLLLN